MFSSNNQKASDNKNDPYQNQLLIIDTIWHSHYDRNCKMLSKNYVIFHTFRGLMYGLVHKSYFCVTTDKNLENLINICVEFEIVCITAKPYILQKSLLQRFCSKFLPL